MELRRISDQGNESLVEYFEQLGQSTHAIHRAISKQMIELILHLQDTVDAPMHWVTTSHFWFYFGAVDHWDPLKARVFVYPHPQGFEIRFRSTQQFIDWITSFESIVASTVIEATAAIQFALEKAILEPDGRSQSG